MRTRGAACRRRISEASRRTPSPHPLHTVMTRAAASVRVAPLCCASLLAFTCLLCVARSCFCVFFPIYARLSVPEEPITARTRTHTHTHTTTTPTALPLSTDAAGAGDTLGKRTAEPVGGSPPSLSQGLPLDGPHRLTLHPTPSLIDQQIELHCSPWEQRCAPVGLCLPPASARFVEVRWP